MMDEFVCFLNNDPLTVTVILHAGLSPGVAESNCFLRVLIVHPGEKVPDRADEGFGNAELSFPHPPSATVPPLPLERVIFFDIRFCDFALRLRAE